MDFAEVEQRFFELKGRLVAGLITQAAFEAAVRELALRDAAGRLWTIGAQTGKWYYLTGDAWVEAQPPPGAATLLSRPVAAPPLPPAPPGAPAPWLAEAEARPSSAPRRSVLPFLAGGCLGAAVLVTGGLVALGFALPGSPWRGFMAGLGPGAGTLVIQASPSTVATVATASREAETAIATMTPVVIVVTATPAPAVSTATAVPAATATPTAAAMATATATTFVLPPSPTATRLPSPSTTPTRVPVVPSPLNVTMSNPHYERWGKPTNPDGCNDYNNGIPVRKFTMQMVVTNNTNQTVAGGWGPSYVSNTGATLARCYYDYQGGTSIPPGQTRNVTFGTFTNSDGGDWVKTVEFICQGRTWRWTLDVNGQIIGQNISSP